MLPEEQREKRRIYYSKNRIKILAKQKEYNIAKPQLRQEYNKRYSAATSEKRRFYKLKYNYGITRNQWEQMFLQQGSCCAICKSTTHGNSGRTGNWHTDHDHVTNKVRGIICMSCNHALGKVKDSISLLYGMINYLEKHK